jgi:hypothetical protein
MHTCTALGVQCREEGSMGANVLRRGVFYCVGVSHSLLDAGVCWAIFVFFVFVFPGEHAEDREGPAGGAWRHAGRAGGRELAGVDRWRGGASLAGWCCTEWVMRDKGRTASGALVALQLTSTYDMQ